MRALWLLAITTLLGVLTTIAVAWGSAAYLSPDHRGRPSVPLDLNIFGPRHSQRANVFAGVRVVLTYTPPLRPWNGQFIAGEASGEADLDAMFPLPPSESIPYKLRWWNTGSDAWPDGKAFSTVIHDARGWPFYALRCHWKGGRLYGNYGSVRYGIELPPLAPNSRLVTLRALPYRVMPAGLAANTGIFAALWLVTLCAPRALVRAIRSRRHLCPRCAYSLLNLPPNSPCPECGHTSSPRRGAGL